MRDRPGFDVVVGNPPWEKIKVERVSFYGGYIPGLRTIKSQKKKELAIVDYERRHPDVLLHYHAEMSRTEQLRQLIQANFQLARSGDPDLYRSFVERALRVARAGGAIGMVSPRNLFASDGTAPYRAVLFPAAEVTVDFGANAGGWMFPDVEDRDTIAVMTALKNGAAVVYASAPMRNIEDWKTLSTARTTWTIDDLRKISAGLAVPLMPNASATTLYRKLASHGQRFDAKLDDVAFIPWAEFHATKDRISRLLQENGKGWPVYAGDCFSLWQPEAEKPTFFADPRDALETLQKKRNRSRTWNGFLPGVLADPKTLPQEHAAFSSVIIHVRPIRGQ